MTQFGLDQWHVKYTRSPLKDWKQTLFCSSQRWLILWALKRVYVVCCDEVRCPTDQLRGFHHHRATFGSRGSFTSTDHETQSCLRTLKEQSHYTNTNLSLCHSVRIRLDSTATQSWFYPYFTKHARWQGALTYSRGVVTLNRRETVWCSVAFWVISTDWLTADVLAFFF